MTCTPTSHDRVPVQGTPEKLLEELVQEESLDDTFVRDFLLTYRTFLKSPTPILEKLKTEWEKGVAAQRDKVSALNRINDALQLGDHLQVSEGHLSHYILLVLTLQVTPLSFFSIPPPTLDQCSCAVLGV